MFAPTLVNQASPSDAVRTVCQTMLEDIDKLAGYAETRQAMAQPTTLDEARALD